MDIYGNKNMSDRTITKQIAIFIGRVPYALPGFGDEYWCDLIEIDKDARICLDLSLVWSLSIVKDFYIGYLYMGVSTNGCTPSHHPFLDGIFPHKNHPAIGVPPWRAGNPHFIINHYQPSLTIN